MQQSPDCESNSANSKKSRREQMRKLIRESGLSQARAAKLLGFSLRGLEYKLSDRGTIRDSDLLAMATIAEEAAEYIASTGL